MPAAPNPPTTNLPAPAANLMPHQRPVRLIERVLDIHAAGGRAGAMVREGSLYVNADGNLEHTAYLEFMAQTFAALKGWRDRRHGHPPQVGYLVGATGVECLGTARIGDKLTTTIQETDTFDTFKIVQGHVYIRDQLLASGQLRLWLKPRHNMPDTLDKTLVKEISRPLTPLKQAINAAASHPLKWETDRIVVQSFCFPPEFIAFQGHFPGNPLLPAFAQIQMAQVMLETAWQAPLQLARIDKAKFREPLRPGQTVNVRCHLDEAPGRRQATATLTVTDRPASIYQMTVRTTERPSG